MLEGRGLLDTPDVTRVDSDVKKINEYTDAFTQKTFGAESVVVTTYEGLDGEEVDEDGVPTVGAAQAGDDDDSGSEEGSEGGDDDGSDDLEDEDDDDDDDEDGNGAGAGAGAGTAVGRLSGRSEDKKHLKRRRSNSNRHGR